MTMESADFEQCLPQDIHNVSREEVVNWLYSTADSLVITILLPIILTLGVINNLTFLFVIFRVPQMQSTINIYLVNLALADLLYLVLSSAYFIGSHLRSPVSTYSLQFNSSAECVIAITVINMGYFTSVVLVTLVSLERYLALCHPIKHLNIRSKKRTKRLVAGGWLVGLLFASSTTTDNSHPKVQCLIWPPDDNFQDLPSIVTTCTAANSWVAYYTRPFEDFPWLIALVSTTFMYSSISLKMHRQKRNRHRNRAGRYRTVKMLLVNSIIFFVCQTPHRVFSMTAWFCLLTEVPNPFAQLGTIIRWISYLPQAVNTIINPLVYGAMNPQYRAAFLQAFQRQVKRRHHSAMRLCTISKSNGNAPTEQLQEM